MQTNCCADAETIIRNTSVAMRLILLRLLSWANDQCRAEGNAWESSQMVG